MDISVLISSGRPWAEIERIAREVDDLGAYAVYIPDHFMPNTADGSIVDGPRLEAWTVLSALSQQTTSVRLGPLVLGGTYRHPAVVANMVASLDHLSGGRAIAGLGAGWQVNEHAAYGIDLMSVRDRSDRFEETVQVVASLLRQPRTTFDGRHFTLTDAPNQPAPLQERLPVLVAGSGEQRSLRTAALYADVWHTWGTPESFAAKSAVLDKRCAEADRDPGEIRRATGFFVEDLADGAATVAPFTDVCDEYVFGDVGAPADHLIEAMGAALARQART
jgi:alkanesulfonate monooxygenase SsuD/methylene tetrahydromethanopterin reductase-like flavin-dependent oxidoreductase (luciferase family)